MSNPFDKLRRVVREMKSSINPIIKETFEQNELIIKDFQVNKQLFEKGEDSKGSIIRPAYSPITIKIKKSKGQPIDRVTLKDKGKLYKSIKVVPKDDHVEITTSIEYAKYLFKKYGDDILGIQEELLRDFTEQYIIPNIKKSFDDKIAKS